MILTMRRTAAAMGLAVLSLASVAHADTVAYEFKTFYDTSTTVTTDTKTLQYSVASLTFTDIAGGVQIKLTENSTAFPEKSGGTVLDKLWFSAPAGTLKAVSGTSPSLLFSSYKSTGTTVEAGNTFLWTVSFSGLLGGGISEGGSSVFNLLGTGVSVASLSSKVMIDLTNVGKPYNTSLLGLGGGNVHFMGKVVAVPEPGTYALMGLGLAGLAAVARRRQA